MDEHKSIGEELAGWGKVALLETTGRVSGARIRNAVGFIEHPDGSLIVAAGSDESDWALNIRSNPECRATVGERLVAYEATEVDGPDRSTGLTELVLKYGTPAEKLGHGPVFRLTPTRQIEAQRD